MRVAKPVPDGLSEIVVAFRRTETDLDEAAVASSTLPMNPLTPFSDIVAILDEPCKSVKILTEDAMVKSCTETVTLVVCDIDPFVPVTVTIYMSTGVVAKAVTLRTAVAVPSGGTVTLRELTEKASPLGDPVTKRSTVPLKLLKLVTVIVDVTD